MDRLLDCCADFSIMGKSSIPLSLARRKEEEEMRTSVWFIWYNEDYPESFIVRSIGYKRE